LLSSSQFLEEEMSDQRVEYERCRDLGLSLASTADTSDPSVNAMITDHIAALSEGWESLWGAIVEAKRRLGFVRKTSAEFEELMEVTRTEVGAVKRRVEGLPAPCGIDPRWTGEQMEECTVN